MYLVKWLLPLLLATIVISSCRSNDIATGVKIANYHSTFTAHLKELWTVVFSPNGQLLASAGVDNEVKIWRKSDGKVLFNLPHPQGVPAVAFSPDGLQLATGSYDSQIRIWDVSSGQLLKTLSGNISTVWRLTYSPDGKTLASGGVDKVLRIWNIASGDVHEINGHEGDIWAVAFSPNGRLIASAGEDTTINIWRTDNYQRVAQLTDHRWAVIALTFSPDGKTLASGGDDKAIKFWQVSETAEPWPLLDTIEGDNQSVYSLAYSPDGRTLTSGCRDKNVIGELFQYHAKKIEQDKNVTIRIWDAKSHALLQALIGHSNDVRSLSYSADGNWLASASEDSSVILWQMVRW